MHAIEPYYNWRHLYTPEEDEYSPFYGKEHSEFEYSETVYNYYIHPQWDAFGSENIYMKFQYIDYEEGFAIIELLGEWNDAIANDIMHLKRNIIDVLLLRGIKKYLFIAENVLSFYADDESYYEEWHEELGDHGWIVVMNLPDQSMEEFLNSRIRDYLFFDAVDNWRTYQPQALFEMVDNKQLKRLV